MAGLPVVVTNVTEIGEFVEKYEVGFVAKDNRVGSINSAIDQTATADLEKLQQNALSASMKHSWEVQEKKMIADCKC